MADWKNLGDRAKNLTLVGLGKARDLGESAKLNLDNVSEEENRKKILAEIGKQWFVRRYVYPNGATWFFPWQLCSIAMYASFLVPFLRGKARDALLTFLGSFSLLAAVIALLVPGDMLRPQIALFCHSFTYHFVMVAESIAAVCILSRREKRAPFLPALIVFLVTAAISEVINVVCHTFFGDRPPVANMFNITPYHPTTQPIFHQIAVSLGILPEIILYLGMIVLGSWGLYRLLCVPRENPLR